MTVDRQPTPRPMATAAVRPGRTRPTLRTLITPLRVVVGVALMGSSGAILYGARVARDATQLPILTAGLVVFGLTWVACAAVGCLTVLRAASGDDTRTAFFAALLGGLSALLAAAALGAAAILGLVWISGP